MDRAVERSHAETLLAAPEVAVPAPAGPVAPMPLPLEGLVVGHAEDDAESDADRRADTALERLRGATDGNAETHQHGAGCDHVRRSPAPSASSAPSALVGYAGGELDAGTSSRIESLRGGGRPLEKGSLARMQTAFGTGLSSVRVHDDSSSAKLASSVSARAFTTGNDIFFGSGEYAPETPEGERVLAHEVAHTLQPEAGVHREVDDDVKAGGDDEAGAAADVAVPEAKDADAAEVAAADHQVLGGNPGEGPGGRSEVEMAALKVTNLADLLKMSDKTARDMSNNSNFDGPLMAVLKNAFESNWFKAKDCLVFGKWPGEARPSFNDETSLRIMSGLTVLRGAIHEAVMPLAKKQVAVEMAAKSKELKGNRSLGDTLDSEKDLDGAKQIDYKGSVGADTVTSDVDVSTGGQNTELGVKAYNQAFRDLMKVEFEPGTVLDLNVYAMDFIHGATMDEKKDSTEKGVIDVKAEHADVPDAADKSAADREQEIWSLVHVARYLPKDSEWTQYATKALEPVEGTPQYAAQVALYVEARSRAKGFRMMLDSMMDELEAKVDSTIASLGTSWEGSESGEHFNKEALQMRAANAMYEKKLLQVKDLRSQIAKLKQDKDADQAKVKKLVSKVAGEISMAQLYANEVYGSGGATVHAVYGMQTKKKKKKEWGKDVHVTMTPQQWFETFNDNLGDVLKDYEHYGKSHGRAPDYYYAAFKMGKYVDRMVDAVPNLRDGGLITADDSAKVEGSRDYLELKELAENHVKEKDGPSKNDPKKLAKKGTYFGDVGEAEVETFKGQAIELNATVRGMVAAKKAAPAPDELDVEDVKDAPPSGPGAADSPAPVLAEAGKAAEQTLEQIAAMEEKIPAPA